MANPFDIAKKLIAWGERAAKIGLSVPDDLQWAIDNPTEMHRVVAFLKEGPLGPVYDGSEVASHLEIKKLSWAAPSITARPGYVTFWDAGWSVFEMMRFCKIKGRHLLAHEFSVIRDSHTALEKIYPWAFVTAEPRWRQFRFHPNTAMFAKTGPKQLALLPLHEKQATIRVVCMAALLHGLIANKPLFKHKVRCSDVVDNVEGAIYVYSNSADTIRFDFIGKDGTDATLDIASEYIL